jgi:hypothetical protein
VPPTCHKQRSPAVFSGQSRSVEEDRWAGCGALTWGGGDGRNCMACKGSGVQISSPTSAAGALGDWLVANRPVSIGVIAPSATLGWKRPGGSGLSYSHRSGGGPAAPMAKHQPVGPGPGPGPVRLILSGTVGINPMTKMSQLRPSSHPGRGGGQLEVGRRLQNRPMHKTVVRLATQ